jgi:hypothetical protein
MQGTIWNKIVPIVEVGAVPPEQDVLHTVFEEIGEWREWRAFYDAYRSIKRGRVFSIIGGLLIPLGLIPWLGPQSGDTIDLVPVGWLIITTFIVLLVVLAFTLWDTYLQVKYYGDFIRYLRPRQSPNYQP